jgi:hypothetical protein
MRRDVARVGLGEAAADRLEGVDVEAKSGGLARGEGVKTSTVTNRLSDRLAA